MITSGGLPRSTERTAGNHAARQARMVRVSLVRGYAFVARERLPQEWGWYGIMGQ